MGGFIEEGHMRQSIEAPVQCMCHTDKALFDFWQWPQAERGTIGFAYAFSQGIHCHSFGSGESVALAAPISGNQEEPS